MPKKLHPRSPSGRRVGVSLLELSIVMAVMLVVAATALPSILTAMQHYRLRVAAKDVAAMLQASRARSVRDNRHYTVREQQVTQGGLAHDQLFLDLNGNSSYDGGEALVQLPASVRFNSASAPALPSATLGYTPQPPSTPLSFNGMGMPCVVRNGICTNWDASGNAVGVIYFLHDTQGTGANWGAVSVSPAGRARTWQWSAGSSQWATD